MKKDSILQIDRCFYSEDHTSLSSTNDEAQYRDKNEGQKGEGKKERRSSIKKAIDWKDALADDTTTKANVPKEAER